MKATPGFEKSLATIDQQTRVPLVLLDDRWGKVIQGSASFTRLRRDLESPPQLGSSGSCLGQNLGLIHTQHLSIPHDKPAVH